MVPLLGVNIDHIATVRQARGTRYPDPLHAALIAEQAGADAITVHLREDRRHIQDRDVELLREMLHIRMNLEMAATTEMGRIACQVRPSNCCLVPEKRAELTTEGGLDVISHREQLTDFCSLLSEAGIQVSLFIDPELEQLDAAAEVGVPIVELHTGAYANADQQHRYDEELTRLRKAVHYGMSRGLIINAGHGLHYHNVAAVAALSGIHELNIGHAIIARALLCGLENAVQTMRTIIQTASTTGLNSCDDQRSSS
jgi:pyridoxine 5-phosphate synthase